MRLSYWMILAVCFLPSAIAETIPPSLTIQFSGVCCDRCINDPTKIEAVSRYKSLAQCGNLGEGITPADVEAWYQFSSAPNSYPFDFTYSKQGDCEKKMIHAPKGTRQIWEAKEEYIKNQSTFFMIIHHNRAFQVGNGDKTALFTRQCFNPMELLFCDSGDRIVETKIADGHRKIVSWTQTDSDKKWYSKTYTYLFESETALNPIKSLIAEVHNSYSKEITLAEMDSFKTVNGIAIPMKIRITQCDQSIDAPLDQITTYGVEMLPPEFTFDLTKQDSRALKPFLYQWDFRVDAFSTDPMTEEFFWPPVPAGYTYCDSREEIFAKIMKYRDPRKIPSSLQQLYRGVGPFTIAAQIDFGAQDEPK